MNKIFLSIFAFFAIGINITRAESNLLPTLAAVDTRFTTVGQYRVTWGYDAINLGKAWTYNSTTKAFTGWTGKGVTVAVFDTGLNTSNIKFTGNQFPGYNIYTDSRVTKDNGWHGTFVAGIIGANMTVNGTQNIYGVAPQSKIMPIQIFDTNGNASWTDAQLARGITYATDMGARIFNNSWNSSATLAEMAGKSYFDAALPQQIQAWRQAANNGALMVWAAGNYGKKDPGYYATLPESYKELAKNWVAVVSVDQNGVISQFSNRCGIAKAYCMAAPGSNILGLYGTGVAIGSGTSFAAPMVSGVAALILHKWPYLKGDQVQSILFSSANKSGIYADKETYGQGMLDANKALNPIGTPTVASTNNVNGKATTITSASINPSPAYGASIASALSQVDVMVLDDYKRDYTVNMAPAVGRTQQLNLWGNQLAVFGAQEVYDGETVHYMGSANGLMAAFSSTDSVDEDESKNTERFGGNVFAPGVKFLDANGKTTNKATRTAKLRSESSSKASAGLNVSPSLGFGPFANNSIRGNDLVLLNSVGNPYMNMAPTSTSGNFSYKWNDNHTTRVGAFTNTAYYDNPANFINGRMPLMTGVNVEHTIKSSLGWVSASTGAVQEMNSVLGAYSTGATSLGNRANTVYGGVSAGVNVTEKLSAFTGANAGWTSTSQNTDSIVKGIRGMVSSNAYVGLVKTGFFSTLDRFGLVISTPMRVNTGVLALSVPTMRDNDGNIYYTNQNVRLKNNNFEYAAQLFYTAPLDQYQSIGLGIGNRWNALDVNSKNHQEAIAMARYNLRF